MKTKTISTRLEEGELAQLDWLASSAGLDRSGMTKSLLRRGLLELRFERAVADYRGGRVTLSRAAEMAGISVWDFMARMKGADLSLQYGLNEFEEDLSAQF
ncbi:UPF0175 family protein [Arthrospira platensis SPKY1]|nr:UPF0175 family protein [Arthrospira platensis SPKY1]